MFRVVLLLIAAATLLLARPAFADDVSLPPGLEVKPLFQDGSASDDDLADAVGNVSFAMDKCPAREGVDDERVVRVQLEKPAFETNLVINALLTKAAQFAWTTCPEPFLRLGSDTPTGQFHYDLSEVDAYLPDGQRAFNAVLGMYGMGDGAFGPGKTYPWRNYNNFAAIARSKAEYDAKQQASAQAQAAYDAQIQAQSAKSLADLKQAGRTVWLLCKIAFWLAVAFGIWLSRETLIRWYYELTPHPAEGTVSAALAGGGPIDGRAFADVLRTSTGNRYEQEVRARQAQELARRLRARAEEQVAELARAKAEALRTASYRRAQTDLASAVEAHEAMKARLDALRNRGKSRAA